MLIITFYFQELAFVLLKFQAKKTKKPVGNHIPHEKNIHHIYRLLLKKKEKYCDFTNISLPYTDKGGILEDSGEEEMGMKKLAAKQTDGESGGGKEMPLRKTLISIFVIENQELNGLQLCFQNI